MAFFALKISDPNATELVNNIKAGSDDLEIRQLNQLGADLKKGCYVFVQLGGDVVAWDKGLIGLASIIRPPYDKGYDPNNSRNFKLGIKMELVLKSVIKRKEFRFYPDVYDAGGIGPNTKGQQDQAIKSLNDTQAYAIIRAMVDNQPSLENDIRTLFDEKACARIFGEIPFMVEQRIDHKTFMDKKQCTLRDYMMASLEQREAYYCAWLVRQKKLNSEENYSEKTGYNYSISLKNDANLLNDLEIEETNLFSYVSGSKFESVLLQIQQCANYVEIVQGNHYTFGNALRTYKDFLFSLMPSKTKETGGYNKIFYGAPGCGKSRHVKDMLKNVSKENIFRVTFHPEYMNCDFVGQILPNITTKKDPISGEEKEIVSYKFNPGPFTLALKRAAQTNEMVYLVIEEINRGNAAAIFGDVFQLLDRSKSSDDEHYGYSEFTIRNTGIQDYFIKIGETEVLIESFDTEVYIPSNLTILATMNSSDQNVFTMDTAFKRRWLFEQISNDIAKDNKHPYKNWYVPGTNVTWQVFLTKINDEILNYKIQNQTNEDKRLGKYFVGKDCLTEKAENGSDVIPIAYNFAYKVFEYIWNDVCKIGRDDWFDLSKYKTLEDVIEAFVNPDTNSEPLSVFRNIDFTN